MSANIQNYIRPTSNQSRTDINKILEALQDLFAAPVEDESAHERICLVPHRKKKSHTLTSGDEAIDAIANEIKDVTSHSWQRSIAGNINSYGLTHSEVGAVTFSINSTRFAGRGDFDGSTSLVIADVPLLDLTDEFTLSGFFYLPATESSDVTQFLIGKGVYSLEVQPHVLGANTIRGSVVIGGTYYDTTGTFNADAWNHISLTWKSPNLKLYINGSLADTNTSATGTLDTNSEDLQLGDGVTPALINPSTAITSTESTLTNSNPIPMTVTFSSGGFTGFTASDVVSNVGTVQNFTDSNPIFTFDVLASTDGTVTVDVPAGVMYTRHGDQNSAAPQFSIVLDTTNPNIPVINVYTPDPTHILIITLTGTGETGSVVTLTSSIDGLIGTDTVAAGTWSITTSALTLGTHSFTATQTDPAGNTSLASSVELITIELGYISMETGGSLLLETGDKIIL